MLMQRFDLPDARGHFGPYGGRVRRRDADPRARRAQGAVRGARRDPAFAAEFARELKHYVGRPSPVYHAERWSRELGGAQIWIKREDLNHTGAHKINNCIGQALLARRLGKPRVIAETGAGQHGVATATVAARYGLECVVYMGSEDVQAPGAERLPDEAPRRDGRAGRVRLEDAEGRAERGDARLGHQRRVARSTSSAPSRARIPIR